MAVKGIVGHAVGCGDGLGGAWVKYCAFVILQRSWYFILELIWDEDSSCVGSLWVNCRMQQRFFHTGHSRCHFLPQRAVLSAQIISLSLLRTSHAHVINNAVEVFMRNRLMDFLRPIYEIFYQETGVSPMEACESQTVEMNGRDPKQKA